MNHTATYWNDQAETFDQAPDHGLRDPATRAAWDSLLVRVMPPPPTDIVDMGCGTGSLALLLANRGHRVTGIDVAARMVEQARVKASDIGAEISFEVCDAMNPPWPPGQFDAVLARHVLWALPNPALALGRWFELLKPDGRLVLIEGRWCTGAGLGASDVMRLVDDLGRQASVTPLRDATLWGGPIEDERYLLVSPPSPTT